MTQSGASSYTRVMPRRGQHDQSPGDGRQPYSDEGGPEGRHAKTHDVRREEATRPKRPEPEEDFSADLASVEDGGGHAAESIPAADDKALHSALGLDGSELARLAILEVGTRLEQGGTYVDLTELERGPFTALGGHEVARGSRIVAKRDTDYELWNRLVGQGREPTVERPESV